MFHFHRFDDGKPLAAGNRRARLDQNRQHLAVHRRAHQAAAGMVGRLVDGKIAQGDLGLAAVAQHIDGAGRGYGDGIGGRRDAVDRNGGDTAGVVDARGDAFAIGDDRQREAPAAGELKGIGGIPWRGGRLGFPLAGQAGLLARQELLRPERGGGAVEALRHGAERGQIAIDEAGIEFAGAEILGAAQAAKKAGIAARTGDEGALERAGKPVERLGAVLAVRDHLGDRADRRTA